MWILTCTKKPTLINMDKIEKVYVSGNEDLGLYSVIGDTEVENYGSMMRTFGVYSTKEIADAAFYKVVSMLYSGKPQCDMPSEEILVKEMEKRGEKQNIEKKQPCMSMEEAINLWNTLADRGFKQVSRRGENTKSGKMLKARLLEYTKEQWEQAIANIRKSDVLQRNQEKWFDFDWFVCPSNFVKVLDGKYNDSATDHMEKTEKEWWEK